MRAHSARLHPPPKILLGRNPIREDAREMSHFANTRCPSAKDDPNSCEADFAQRASCRFIDMNQIARMAESSAGGTINLATSATKVYSRTCIWAEADAARYAVGLERPITMGNYSFEQLPTAAAVPLKIVTDFNGQNRTLPADRLRHFSQDVQFHPLSIEL